jgi:hypothetical protein
MGKHATPSVLSGNRTQVAFIMRTVHSATVPTTHSFLLPPPLPSSLPSPLLHPSHPPLSEGEELSSVSTNWKGSATVSLIGIQSRRILSVLGG